MQHVWSVRPVLYPHDTFPGEGSLTFFWVTDLLHNSSRYILFVRGVSDDFLHTGGVLVFLNFWQFSRELKETGSSGVCSFCWNFTERQVLWSLCSVDFHTFTLQLPIQTPHSVAPELQVFVSSLKISAKRAHPRHLEIVNSKIGFATSYSFHLSSFFMYCQFTTLWWWFV